MQDMPKTDDEWLDDFGALMAFHELHQVVHAVGAHVWRMWLTGEERAVIRALDATLAARVDVYHSDVLLHERAAILDHLPDVDRAAVLSFVAHALRHTERDIEMREESLDALYQMIESLQRPIPTCAKC